MEIVFYARMSKSTGTFKPPVTYVREGLVEKGQLYEITLRDMEEAEESQKQDDDEPEEEDDDDQEEEEEEDDSNTEYEEEDEEEEEIDYPSIIKVPKP